MNPLLDLLKFRNQKEFSMQAVKMMISFKLMHI